MDRIPKSLIVLVFLVAFIGFVDASYLAVEALSGNVPPCFITGGCDVVTTSTYSKILGIPIALLGAIYYLSILVLWILFIDKDRSWVLKIFPWVTAVGFLFSLRLVYLQVFTLKALCSYCLISAGTSTLLFILALLVRKYSETDRTINPKVQV